MDCSFDSVGHEDDICISDIIVREKKYFLTLTFLGLV